jgi:hypothetical protein
MKSKGRTATLLTLLLLLAPAGADSTNAYGFSGFEIYKLARGISGLTAADVDKDGMQDLLVINNAKAKIEVMLRRKDPVPPKAKTGEKLPNDLADDQFFERKEILTEKQVWALGTGDLDGDGHLDVAYYGKPHELVVAYGDSKGDFKRTKSISIEDVQASGNGIAVADLDGDKRADLALLSKGYTAIYFQTEKGTLAEPRKVPHAVKGVSAVDLLDINGDGRTDLLHVAPASARSVRVRFTGPDGALGAEIAFETSPWRVLDFHDVAPGNGAEMIVVQRTSGLLRALKMASEPAKGVVPLGTPEVHAFQVARGGKPRSMAIGDVNGDKRLDLVVTEPGTAQVAVYLQRADGQLGGRRTFPSLSDSEALRVADLDGDGKAEVVVLSKGEKSVGTAALGEGGRLPFPTLLGMDGAKPLAMDTGDLSGDGGDDLVVVVDKDKKRTALIWTGEPEPKSVELTGLKSADDLMILDIDQDGNTDLLLFDLFGPMRVWLGDGKLGFAEQKAESGSALVRKLGRGNVGVSDIDGDGKVELLVTSKNFARAIVLDRQKGYRIKEQANGRSPTSQVKGVAAVDLDGDGKPEVALFDREKNKVTVLKRGRDGVFEVAANLSAGDVDYRALLARDINGDGRADLVVFGKNKFSVLYAGGKTHKYEEMFSIESTVRDASLQSFAVGDLNGDKQADIAAIDSGNRGVQVFSFDAQTGFKQRLNWPVYQKKMHEQRRRSSGIADIVCADLTGDGLVDLALIIHDRLIVYPQ